MRKGLALKQGVGSGRALEILQMAQEFTALLVGLGVDGLPPFLTD